MNKYELISVTKYLHINEIVFCCFILINIKNGRWVLDIAEKLKNIYNDEYKNILCEIFYVVSVRMSGQILED